MGALVEGDIAEDEITKLPGWDSKLPSKHYSGLIDVGSETGVSGKLHYWFIQSERDPASDPVVLWLNGGPGSSSLIGLFQENGQLNTNDDSMTNKSGGVPRLFYNKWGWTQMASMIYLESPKGVGFSYCDKPSKCHNTDESTAIDNHEFLVNFFKGFSEFAKNDFYIVGESYAGVYIPMLIDQIDKRKVLTNFKGAAIGNGCWGSDCFYGQTELEIDSHIYFGHHLISQTLHARITSACSPNNWSSAKCRRILYEIDDQAGDFNIYNIYDTCASDGVKVSQIRDSVRKSNITLFKASDSYHIHPQLKQLNDYKCGTDRVMSLYLKNKEVRKAIHVNQEGHMKYKLTCGDLRPLYKKLFQKYRILIFSGDADACVPHWGTERWTREMNFDLTYDWHLWDSVSMEKNLRVTAGYVINYEHLTYVTVKGAGHMVPQYKPAFALTMFKNFLENRF